jgi:hypothetical protein
MYAHHFPLTCTLANHRRSTRKARHTYSELEHELQWLWVSVRFLALIFRLFSRAEFLELGYLLWV